MNNRIIVVDDEPMVRDVVSQILERGGYEVVVEQYVDKAFEKFHDFKPFLCIVDLRLQNHVDGATLAGMIRRTDPFAICVCLTGILSPFDKGYLLGGGIFTDILLKPIDRKLLLKITEYAQDKYDRWKSY